MAAPEFEPALASSSKGKKKTGTSVKNKTISPGQAIDSKLAETPWAAIPDEWLSMALLGGLEDSSEAPADDALVLAMLRLARAQPWRPGPEEPHRAGAAGLWAGRRRRSPSDAAVPLH